MTEKRTGRLDFGKVNRAAMADLPSILRRWLPDGRVVGQEFVALNPRRADRRPGSFRINCHSAMWCDFACGAKGNDPTSYLAYVLNVSQTAAARRLAEALGIDPEA